MKYTVSALFLAMIFFISGCKDNTEQGHQLVKLWESDSVLKVPESVLFDAAANVLYVSNIDGADAWGNDSTGSIGKLSTDGKVIEVDWVSGLSAPKGLGMFDGKLYVADLTDLVVINIDSAKIEKRIPVPGAVGLNDVAVSSTGDIYISDSKDKKVFAVKNGIPELYLENLSAPNGVLVYNGSVYVLDNGGLYKVNEDKTLMKLADGMECNADGVENLHGNEFIVSCWEGVIWHISEDGTKQILLDGREQEIRSADIGIDANKGIIYVPTFWRNTVAAYQVN